MHKQKILLFGGTGFLGSRIINQLKQEIIISPSRQELDLVNIDQVYRKIDLVEPDIVIYSAGVTKIDAAEKNEEQAYSLNADVPGKIAKFISSKNIPIVYISTDAVYDGYEKKYIFSETDKPNPKSIYGKSKLKGEEKILEANQKNAVIRLITLFGIDYNRSNFLTNIFNDLKGEKEVVGIMDQIQNPTEVNIAAKATALIAEKKLSGIYHLGSLDWDTNYNFVLKFAHRFGFDQSLIKKISYDEFMKNKSLYRKKNSVLLCNKFSTISKNSVLKTIDDSINYIFHEYNNGK